MRRLLVDDEADVVVSLKAFLEVRIEGVQVTGETTSRGALERMERERFDLVMADFRMPGMTGIELRRRVQQLNPDAWRVLATAYPASALPLSDADREVPHRVFLKPLATDPFIAELRKLLASDPPARE